MTPRPPTLAAWRLVLLLLGVLLFAGQPAGATERVEIQTLDEPTSLIGLWSFRPGDDPSWADRDLDDSDWESVEVPSLLGSIGHAGHTGYAWYRLELVVDVPPSDLLAVTTGHVMVAHEFYADGELLGSVGSLPPDLEFDWDRHAIRRIPRHTYTDDGRVVLAIRTYMPPDFPPREGGIYKQPLEAGSLDDLVQRELLREMPALVLTLLYIVVALFHLHMWSRRREQVAYLWFGLVVLDVAAYTFMRSQWKYWVSDAFVLMKEFEYVVLYPLPALFVVFLAHLMGRRLPLQRFVTWFCGALAVVAALPGLALNSSTLLTWEVVAILAILIGVGSTIRAAFQGDTDAQAIVFGLTVSGACFLFDIAGDRGLHRFPWVVPWGFLVLVLSMAMSLSNRFMRTHGELDDLRLDLERRVAERTHELADANATLRDQAHRLKELDERKTNFFQNISHELRTPLQLILGPLGRERERHPESRDLRVVESNSRRLLRLVDQLLEYQKLAAGKYELKLRALDIEQALAHCASTFHSFAEERGLDLELALPHDPDPPMVLADAQSFDHMVFNFLSNACKHTPRGGRITVGYERRDERIRVFVQDDGPGIAQEDQHRLFKLFSQVDDADTRRVEGTGLGLALVKQLAEAQGGTVGVETDAGAGARFWLELEVVETEDVPEPTQGFPVKNVWIGDDTERSISLADLQEPLPPDDEDWILAVDDHLEMCRYIEEILTDAGYVVRTRHDPFAARRLLESHRPSLILLDWMMPGMSGPQLLESIRQDDRLVAVPVVLVTAKAENRLEGAAAGADGFIGKPFDPMELVSTVRNLLRLKARERELEALQERMTHDVLARFLPPEIAEQVASGEVQLDQEPKMFTVTMLFADVAGFMSATENLRASAAARFVNEYLGTMADIVFRYGGTIDKFMGDGVMAIFGAPIETAHHVQVESAVGAARAMHAAMAELSERWADQLDRDLHLRIGIHHGPAIVGSFGSATKSDYTAIGPTVNLASRIESVTEPGSTWVSGVIADYLPEAAVTSVGGFELKGHGHVRLFQVVPGHRSATPPPRARRGDRARTDPPA